MGGEKLGSPTQKSSPRIWDILSLFSWKKGRRMVYLLLYRWDSPNGPWGNELQVDTLLLTYNLNLFFFFGGGSVCCNFHFLQILPENFPGQVASSPQGLRHRDKRPHTHAPLPFIKSDICLFPTLNLSLYSFMTFLF